MLQERGGTSHSHVWQDDFFDNLAEDVFGTEQVGMSFDFDNRSQQGHCFTHELGLVTFR